MSLFQPDFLRPFAFGFLGGALIVTVPIAVQLLAGTAG